MRNVHQGPVPGTRIAVMLSGIVVMLLGTASPALAQSMPTVTSVPSALTRTPTFHATWAADAATRTRLPSRPALSEMPRVDHLLRNRAYAQISRAAAHGGFGRLTAPDLFAKVPTGVRLSGESAVLDYLRNHQVSHIRSVKTTPSLAASPSNVLFEPSSWNTRRGDADMRFEERARVRLHNGAAGVRSLASTALLGSTVYAPYLRWAIGATTSHPAIAARTGAFGARALTLTHPGFGAAGAAGTLARWGYQAWTGAVTRAAGRAILRAGAAGAAGGALLSIATEVTAGAVRVMNCPPEEWNRCGYAAVAADMAPRVATAALAGAAIGSLTKAAALAGVAMTGPVGATGARGRRGRLPHLHGRPRLARDDARAERTHRSRAGGIVGANQGVVDRSSHGSAVLVERAVESGDFRSR